MLLKTHHCCSRWLPHLQREAWIITYTPPVPAYQPYSCTCASTSCMRVQGIMLEPHKKQLTVKQKHAHRYALESTRALSCSSHGWSTFHTNRLFHGLRQLRYHSFAVFPISGQALCLSQGLRGELTEARSFLGLSYRPIHAVHGFSSM